MMLKQSHQLKTHERLDVKLREDDLYTLLYTYVDAFAPTPDLMVFTGKKRSAAEIKVSIDQSLKQLRNTHQVDFSPVAQKVFDLVGKALYDPARNYLRDRIQKVEQEIKTLK
ncbi:MAG: hypothetical protein K8L97_20775 [Anaerolineae bacterium]|nr:hypothetical protein [Anaerolineae bacterium]